MSGHTPTDTEVYYKSRCFLENLIWWSYMLLHSCHLLTKCMAWKPSLHLAWRLQLLHYFDRGHIVQDGFNRQKNREEYRWKCYKRKLAPRTVFFSWFEKKISLKNSMTIWFANRMVLSEYAYPKNVNPEISTESTWSKIERLRNR